MADQHNTRPDPVGFTSNEYFNSKLKH